MEINLFQKIFKIEYVKIKQKNRFPIKNLILNFKVKILVLFFEDHLNQIIHISLFNPKQMRKILSKKSNNLQNKDKENCKKISILNMILFYFKKKNLKRVFIKISRKKTDILNQIKKMNKKVNHKIRFFHRDKEC